MPAAKQKPNGVAAPLAVIEGPIVHVHPDESVGATALETARVLHGVIECSSPVLKPVRYAGAQVARYISHDGQAKILPYNIAAEWKGQPSLLVPPLTHVGDQVQTAISVGELPLMDEKPQFYISIHHGVFD